MGTASQAVDSRTRQRLATRRLIVVDADAARADAFVQAVRAVGATAVAVCSAEARLEDARKLDAEVMLVNVDEPLICRPTVAALRAHSRTRWAALLPISFAELWPAGADGPDLVRIADRVSALAAPAIELAVRAKGKLPYATALEPLGPNRLLRALANTGRKLRIALSDEYLRAEIELADGRINGARARASGDTDELINAEALAAVLAMTSGRVLIEDAAARAPDSRSRWNVSLNGALSAAAALDQPVPEALEPSASGIAIDPPSRVQPASAIAASALETSGLFGNDAQPTVPRISLAELYAQHEASAPSVESAEATAREPHGQGEAFIDDATNETTRVVEPPDPSVIIETTAEAALDVAAIDVTSDEQQARAASAAPASVRVRRKRVRAPAVAVACLTFAGALAMLAYPQSIGDHASRRVPSAGATAATPQRPVPAATLAAIALDAPAAATAAAEAAQAAEPAVASGAEPPSAGEAAASEATPRAPPTRDELRRAKRLTDQAKRYRRAHRQEQAAATYLKALELVPDHQEATLGMVRLHLASGNGAEAVRWAKRLTELQPAGQSNQLLLGEAYALNGERALAEQAWRRASSLGSVVARKHLRRDARDERLSIRSP